MYDIISTRNKLAYSIGCIGRDLNYTFVNSFLIYFLTTAVGLADFELISVGVVMTVARAWDAINDPIMGNIVDNTNTRFGKFKPWIMTGVCVNSIFTFLLFKNFNLTGIPFLLIFGFTYILWGMSYTINDISYWSMLPSLSSSQKEREKIGALTRICANIGLFVAMAVTPIVYNYFVSKGLPLAAGFEFLSFGVPLIFLIGQILVFFGVKESKNVILTEQSKTKFKDIFKMIKKNDQLMAIVISILLFNTGYFITTSLGLYFFDYDYKGIGTAAFTQFAIIIGVTQIFALSIYPLVAKFLDRKKFFTLAIILVVIGYLGFFLIGYVPFLPMSMLSLVFIGFFLFSGQAFIQLLILVMLADTIEYGQWKLGKRNDAIIFSLQPFVVKMASAIQAGIVTITLVVSKLNPIVRQVKDLDKLPMEGRSAGYANILSQVTPEMTLMLRFSMLVLPLVLIILSYIVYLKFYKIDKVFYEKILSDIELKNKL